MQKKYLKRQKQNHFKIGNSKDTLKSITSESLKSDSSNKTRKNIIYLIIQTILFIRLKVVINGVVN